MSSLNLIKNFSHARLTYTILGGALVATLILGLWAGKDVKTMKDYVLANRELSTAVVTMSLVATFIGAGKS
ncbi:MAG: hypothetical protein AAF380_02090 [Bacteroidota bacterium]